jgi:tetratricopeptide (TPR) repeat protein
MKTKVNKSVFLGMGILFIAMNLSAQRMKIYQNPNYGPDSVSRMECAMNLSIMDEYVKINSYELAVDAWKECFLNCPASSKNIYINGAKILKFKIENETDDVVREGMIDTLMLLYDKRIEYFKQPGYVYGKKGLDLLRYRKSAVEEAYGYMEKSVDLREDKVDESVAMTFISATYALMQQDVLGPDAMINNYVKIMDLLEEKLASGDKDPKIPQAMENVEKVFAESGAADCESLIAIFEPKFKAAPEDLDLLKKITGLLAQTKCEESDLYAKAAEAQYKIEPSAGAAANLAKVFVTRGELRKAEEYYTNAISQETDDTKKAEYYFYLGKIDLQNGNFQGARTNARSAIALKADFGDAYILIGDAYASSSKTCGETDFEHHTAYWAAVDKYQKAISVDPAVTEAAKDKIALYSKYFPNKEEAFFNINNFQEGMSYTVGGWIQESTIVRTTN